jgi:4a-hydroxytetrahydrobiopterin dehydratase
MLLHQKKCSVCTGDTPALLGDQVTTLLTQLEDGWQLQAGKKLTKKFPFKNFAQPMQLANAVAQVAEAENHHPDLQIKWGELKVDIWTHAIDGLSENDFILAAKIDKCATQMGR